MIQNKKLRVIHVIWNAKFGGIEKLVFELAEEQNQQQTISAEVLIVKKEGELLNQFKSGNFKSHFLNWKRAYTLSWHSYRNVVKLFKNYDVLHLHFFNPLLVIAMLFSKKQIVYTEHGNFGFGRKKKMSDKLLFFLKKRFLNRKDITLTFNSKFTKNHAEKTYNLSRNISGTVIYNGINLSLADCKTTTRSNQEKLEILKKQLAGQFVIGTSSRFVGFKRIDRLIRAFGKIAQPENSILLLVGDGVLMHELKNLVKELNLEDRVVFTGFVEDIRSYQMLFNVCVFPSSMEPFGLVAVETLSIGKPTLVYQDGGGIVEIIYGISKQDIVKNENELITRINHYQNCEQSEYEILERKKYANNFSIELMAKTLETVYLKEF